MKIVEADYTVGCDTLHYYEVQNDKPALLLIHAQGSESMSFHGVLCKLSKHYHLYLVDCYGHGKSDQNPLKYNLRSLGEDILAFTQDVIQQPFSVLGHSSGGLIAAYIAANCPVCTKLILEDAPLFSCVGEARYNTFNYVDLSTVCHEFLQQTEERDFPYYYVVNQYCWNFFPDNSREDIRSSIAYEARKYRKKHPGEPLRVPMWPRRGQEAFRGLHLYDPRFGETFYNNEFHVGINYHALLAKIKCPTLFLKAKAEVRNGILLGALSDEDLNRTCALIKNMVIEYFNCGHGIHTDKRRQFLNAVIHF